jgi:RNA polymerase sigma factor (sigma-70 family)
MPDELPEDMRDLAEPIIRRLQQAFAHEEPATELVEVRRRAARYRPAPGHGLTAADLAAARRREPAAVSRIYTAYAPALFRFFMAAVGDRHQAEDLTGIAFVSAIEGLPRFHGPIEALGGWLFQIARHDLDDFRRRQTRSRTEPLEDNLGETAVAAGAPQVVGRESGTKLDGEDVEPRAMLPQLFRPLNRLSPREREVLALLGRGWSNARIGRELYISPHTVRTHVQNILQKLEMHSKLEAATFAMQHGSSPTPADFEGLPTARLEGSRAVAAMRELSPDLREVLLLRMAAGLTAPEVAEILGKTTGAVKALQHRGLASLARVLGGLRSPREMQERPYLSPDPPRLTSQEEEER